MWTIILHKLNRNINSMSFQLFEVNTHTHTHTQSKHARAHTSSSLLLVRKDIGQVSGQKAWDLFTAS